jgi:hypothetical protein
VDAVSLQVVDGVDKGRVYLGVRPPIAIGRDEGNDIRLNDERVSRFHAKVITDADQIVLTDLGSTNGTFVNGVPIRLRLLRFGDLISVGNSRLIFGTPDQIGEELRRLASASTMPSGNTFHGNDWPRAERARAESVNVFGDDAPALPSRLSPAQAAELCVVLNALHRTLGDATGDVCIPEDESEASISIEAWNRIKSMLPALARYSREVADCVQRMDFK